MKTHIVSEEKFNNMRKKLEKGEWDDLHVLADFDRTLTYGSTSDGEKTPSIISLLRDGDYLDADYRKKAHALHDKYHPIEVDPSATREEKKRQCRPGEKSTTNF